MLVFRQHFRLNLFQSELLTHGFGGLAIVTRHHHDFEAITFKRLNCFSRGRLNWINHTDDTRRLPIDGYEYHGLPFFFVTTHFAY